MKYVRLRLQPTEASLSPAYGALASVAEGARLRFGGVNDEGDRTYVFSVAGPLDAISTALAEAEGVHASEWLRRGDGYGLVYVRAEPTPLEATVQAAFTQGSLVTGLPVDLDPDGSVVFRVLGDPAELTAAIEEVRETAAVTVERLGEYDRPHERLTAVLTDRQTEAVETALELGYYDLPRAATHEDVAAALGCAPSTASEHLRKAESALLREIFAADHW